MSFLDLVEKIDVLVLLGLSILGIILEIASGMNLIDPNCKHLTIFLLITTAFIGILMLLIFRYLKGISDKIDPTYYVKISEILREIKSQYTFSQGISSKMDVHCSKIQSIIQAAHIGCSIEYFQWYNKFYEKATSEVEKAEHTIDVTHFYPFPPSENPNSADYKYFQAINKAAKNRVHIRRIVSASTPVKKNWVRQSIKELEDQQLYNFDIKLNQKIDDEFPMMNLLIFDDVRVFLGIYRKSNSADKTLFFNNHNIEIASVFTEYFNYLWVNSTPLYINGKKSEEISLIES